MGINHLFRQTGSSRPMGTRHVRTPRLPIHFLNAHQLPWVLAAQLQPKEMTILGIDLPTVNGTALQPVDVNSF